MCSDGVDGDCEAEQAALGWYFTDPSQAKLFLGATD